MNYFKKLMFMMRLENRPINLKISWFFSWMLLPYLFKEEFNTEYSFKKNIESRWSK